MHKPVKKKPAAPGKGKAAASKRSRPERLESLADKPGKPVHTVLT